MRIKLSKNEIVEVLDVVKDDLHNELTLYCIRETIHINFDDNNEMNKVFNLLYETGVVDNECSLEQ